MSVVRRFSSSRLSMSRLGMATVLALVVTTAGVNQLSGADAATPASGTVSTTAPSVSWTGGPFTVANVTGNALDQPDCSAPSSCDDFLVHVNTPAGYESGHQLKIQVGWANTAADFDVYVLDADGNVVSTAASSADPEQAIIPPAAGDYTVRVVPFAPLGESYTASATLRKTPANPPPSTETAPGFTDYAAPSNLNGANDAGEPSIGNSFRTGATMYQAGLSTFKVLFDNASPAAATWSDVSATAANGCPQGSTVSLDPILFTDRVTGRTFESQLTGVNSATCYTDDDGQSWLPRTGGGIPSGVDHQTIGGGVYAAGVGGLPVTAYPNEVYYCSQDIATAFCAASRDGGTTFGPGVPTYNLTQCGGLHGHVKVGPDGTAYLPNKSCGATAAVAVSHDNGLSWQVQSVTGSTPGDSDPSVGISGDNTVYFGYVGADGKPAVATSTDGGQTWENQQTVGNEFGIQNAVFPAVVAGDGPRAAFAYLGTPTGGNPSDINTFHGVWHLYVSYTYDGGRSWVTSDATPNDPVQRGSICTAGTTCGDDRNLLDFIDATIDDHGRVLVGFADGCIGACVNDPNVNNRDAYATIARQSTGKTLFSRYDAVANVKAVRASVVQKSNRLVGTFVVKNTGPTALSAIDVQITDNGNALVVKQVPSLAPGAKATVKYSWHATPGTHQVAANVDPANHIDETNEGDNTAATTISVP